VSSRSFSIFGSRPQPRAAIWFPPTFFVRWHVWSQNRRSMRRGVIGSSRKLLQVKICSRVETMPCKCIAFSDCTEAMVVNFVHEFFSPKAQPEKDVDDRGLLVDARFENLNAGGTNGARITNRINICLCSHTTCCLSRHCDNQILWTRQGMESRCPF